MIKSIEIKNFKAIEKAKIKLTPLTAFIGYNGTGKSSMLEALETYRTIVTDGLNAAMLPFKGFEHIYYKGKKKNKWFEKEGIKFKYSPVEFSFDLWLHGYTNQRFNAEISTSIAQESTGEQNVYFLQELYSGQSRPTDIDETNITKKTEEFELRSPDSKNFSINYAGNFSSGQYHPDKSMISSISLLRDNIEKWQFLSMNTFLMGMPLSKKRTSGETILNKDGSNIAEYILSVRSKSPEIFEGIIETIQYVLPYAKDIQPQITSELERLVYLQLNEQDFKIPGWLLSTGTLKVLALLSVFRNPDPAPLIAIEEIENGLDPRTINLVISEIREFVKDKKSQVIITTHSPYLLDLLHLSQVVFVERKDGNVIFNRPYDFEQLRTWSKEYTPGEMYRKDLIQQIIK